MDSQRINPYLDRDGFLYRLHPLVKLALLVATFFTAYVMEDFLAVLPVAGAVAILLVISRGTENVRRLRVLFFAIPTGSFLIWSFFYGEGERVPVVGALGVTWEGMRYGVSMALKLETFLASSVLFLSITRVEEFTAALAGIGVPHRVSFTIALSFRLVPLFLSSALAVAAAQRARGLEHARGGLLARLRRYVPVLVPVFMGALRRADAMAVALEARGFSSSRPRTVYPRARFGRGDAATLALLVATAVVYLGARVLGYGRMPT